MSDNITVYVPPATDIVVKGFTNAGYLQYIHLEGPGIADIDMTGSGESNTLIGQAHLTTPPGDDFPLLVTIMNSPDGGTSWKPSDIYLDSCTKQAFNLAVVVSEDLGDEDYNDAVCLISWPQVPTSAEG